MLIFIICIKTGSNWNWDTKQNVRFLFATGSLIHYEIFSTFGTLKYTFLEIFGCRKELEVQKKIGSNWNWYTCTHHNDRFLFIIVALVLLSFFVCLLCCLLFTDSDYHFAIFKLIIQCEIFSSFCSLNYTFGGNIWMWKKTRGPYD